MEFALKDYNTVPFVGFQNDYVPVLSETPQDAVFFRSAVVGLYEDM